MYWKIYVIFIVVIFVFSINIVNASDGKNSYKNTFVNPFSYGKNYRTPELKGKVINNSKGGMKLNLPFYLQTIINSKRKNLAVIKTNKDKFKIVQTGDIYEDFIFENFAVDNLDVIYRGLPFRMDIGSDFGELKK
ncbi:MAG: hypothetical protein ACOC4G_02435 [Bacillota bacterium]